MPTDTSVKYLHSGMPGAPVLNGVAGSMIGVLDACLVNGFASSTVDSVVIAGGVGTVTRAAGHPAEKDAVMLLAGATVTGGTINREHKVISATPTAWTFDATGLANQSATGAITQKVAPVGWVKQFAGTNLAAYKPSEPSATGCLVRVDDTGAKTCRAVGYGSMSDINTGADPFPTAAQVTGGHWWPKSDTAGAAARGWVMYADAKMFFVAVQYNASATGPYSLSVAFGDPINFKSGDPWGCVINGMLTDRTGNTPGTNAGEELDYVSVSASQIYYPRPSTGLGSAIQTVALFQIFGPNTTTARSGEAQSSMTPFPNPVDGGLYVVPEYLIENNNKAIRSMLPGFFAIPQAVGRNVFAHRDTLVGVAGLPGRSLKVLNTQNGCFLFDVTGPWR